MGELITREFHVRADSVDERTVIGTAVPYNTPIAVSGYREQFAPGSVEGGDDAILFWSHSEPIGRITDHSDDTDGWTIQARISATPRGDEAYTLLKDEVISKFSIGFEPIEEREEDDGTITRTKVKVREVSLVPFPAYETANVAEVRNQQKGEPAMPNEDDKLQGFESALDEVRTNMETIERQVSTLQVVEPEPVADTRSAGEVLKAIAQGDESTIRQYSGGTTSDSVVKDGWVGDLTRIVEEAATMRSVFSSGNLPAEGMSIEFAKLYDNSIEVKEQTSEGDDLEFGKIQLETDTAPVKTFGGYSQLTRQEIERSSVNILDATLRAQAIATGKALNGHLRDLYETVHGEQVSAGNTVTVADNGSYGDWLDGIVDAAQRFDELGLPLDALIVPGDTFKELAGIQADDGRPVFSISGSSVNNVGNLNVAGLAGDIANVTVVLDAGLSEGEEAFVNSKALRLYTSPVVRLQDENIINLSRDFSVYTYAAAADEIPAAIVPVVGAPVEG